MKFKKTSLLPLLLIVPLFMANSPAPVVKAKDYKDFTCEYLSKTKKTDSYGEDYYSYEFSFTNTGSGYIKGGHVSCDEFDLYLYINTTSLFGYVVIGPGETKTMDVGLKVDHETVTNPKYKCTAYQDFMENAFTSDKKEITVNSESGNYVYTVNFDADSVRDAGYKYGIISELTYKGEKYVTHHEIGQIGTSFTLCNSEEELDLSQLTINKLVMTRSKYETSTIAYVIYAILIILGVGLVFIVSGGIFLIIFFSIRKARRRKAARMS